MKKTILTILILLTIISLQAQDSKIEKKEETKTLSEADKKWLEEYMKIVSDGEKIQTKLEKSKKLGKTLDELTNMVGADK